MKSILKWVLIIGGFFLVLVIAAVLILPKVIDVKKYKPVIEQKVAETTGRSFTFGDDIDVSVFPWVGIKLTDLHLGNPSGFKTRDMISVKTFEVRLKVMPLLSRQIEVKNFVIDTPEIYLEKLKSNRNNWQDLGLGHTKSADTEKAPSSGTGLPIKTLQVTDFSITNGRVIYEDQGAGVKKEISDLALNLSDISLETPLGVSFHAKIDGKPVSLEGKAGPIGKVPGRGIIAIDLVLKALEHIQISLTGSLTEPAVNPVFDFEVTVSPFSPRKLAAELGKPFLVHPKDLTVLDKVSLKTRVKGNLSEISLSGGDLKLDDTSVTFFAAAKSFALPDLTFDLSLDAIDLDRYLPEPTQGENVPAPGQSASGSGEEKKTDYSPVRSLVLDGNFRAGKLKVQGATVENVNLHVRAQNGVITLDPLEMNLYRGSLASMVAVDVGGNEPLTRVTLNARGIQAGPMMKDVMKKEMVEGTLKADIDLAMTGKTPDLIRQTLTGRGDIVFQDGAIIGFDLAGAVRSVQVNLGLAEKPTEKPRTDFAELTIPFTAKNGQVNTSGTSLSSPLMRVLVKGDVDLIKELLDLRIDPKVVATLKGQGDTEQRSGIMVPVRVTGPFTAPKIRPDLKDIIPGSSGLDPEALKKQVLGTQGDGKANIEEKAETVKKQLKSLLPGLTN